MNGVTMQYVRAAGVPRGVAQGGGQFGGAAEQSGHGDRVDVVVVADDLAVAHPDHAEGGVPLWLPGRL